MEDTSFAIHPEKHGHTTNNHFVACGNIQKIITQPQALHLECQHGFLTVRFVQEDIARISFHPTAPPKENTSIAVISQPEKIETAFQEEPERLIFKSAGLTLFIDKTTSALTVLDADGTRLFSDHHPGMGYDTDGHVYAYHTLSEKAGVYGLGEKTGYLNKRCTKTTMWNTDIYAPHNPETEALYQSIPFMMTVFDGRAYGLFFDNTFKSYFDLQTLDGGYRYEAEGGMLDYYIFRGPTPKKVIEQYTRLTGRMPLPPKWALGYHQSRYSYMTDAEVIQLKDTFVKKGIPLDAIHLDIHYMKGYRVFTFDPERFPNPESLVNELKKDGIHIVPIVDPGVKADSEYSVFRDGVLGGHFCRYIDGQIYYGDVWPGKSAFPDFANSETRRWWGELHQFYSDLGIEGIWNDMNEPAVFNKTKTMDLKVMHQADGKWVSHREYHNVYGLMTSLATYEGMKKLLNGRRPFVLTRAGYAGIQRYAAVWTGDNRSFWEHLEMAIPMLLNLGVSGVPFAGTDVGGFAYDTNGELLTRWTQLGVFSPFFRNHSALDFARQEPWSFGEKYESIIKKYIRLRYQFLPYLYTLFKEAESTGCPIMRPLFLEYPDDDETLHLYDQFMVGENILVAPILRPGITHRLVYFPKGEWIDYWTNEIITGGEYRIAKTPLDVLPIYIKRGAVIPEGKTNRNADEAFTEMTFQVYPKKGNHTFVFYDDDGQTFHYRDGAFNEYSFDYSYDEKRIKIDLNQSAGNLEPNWKKADIILHNIDKDVIVTVNGKQVEPEWSKNEGRIRIL